MNLAILENPMVMNTEPQTTRPRLRIEFSLSLAIAGLIDTGNRVTSHKSRMAMHEGCNEDTCVLCKAHRRLARIEFEIEDVVNDLVELDGRSF